MDSNDRFLFPWFARCNGGVFLAVSFDVVTKCPFCGYDGKTDKQTNAFEAGHVRRIWGGEFGIK